MKGRDNLKEKLLFKIQDPQFNTGKVKEFHKANSFTLKAFGGRLVAWTESIPSTPTHSPPEQSVGQVEGSEGQLERFEGQMEGSEGQPKGSEGQSEGFEGQPGVTCVGTYGRFSHFAEHHPLSRPLPKTQLQGAPSQLKKFKGQALLKMKMSAR